VVIGSIVDIVEVIIVVLIGEIDVDVLFVDVIFLIDGSM
jgi:hypothetical protein